MIFFLLIIKIDTTRIVKSLRD